MPTNHTRSRTGDNWDRTVYKVRNHPELFPEYVRDSINDTRAAAVQALRTVVDWDCHRCQRAVITPSYADPCPHCRSQDGVLPESSHHRLGRAMFENWCANEAPVHPAPQQVLALIER